MWTSCINPAKYSTPEYVTGSVHRRSSSCELPSYRTLALQESNAQLPTHTVDPPSSRSIDHRTEDFELTENSVGPG
jgi:hypothetical protein